MRAGHVANRPGMRPRMGSRLRLALLTAAVAVVTPAAFAAPVAQAAPANIIAGDPVLGNVFNPTTYSHDAGTLATMTWNGGASHDVESTNPAFPFSSGAPIAAGTDTVDGTQFLPPGSYGFVCSVHAPAMAGTLNVSGTPLSRPSATVVIKSRTVESVVGSGKLKVKVTASPGATGNLIAKLGKKTIGKASSLAARAIKLTRGGRRVLGRKKTAKVKVTAEVDFGTPASASKKLK